MKKKTTQADKLTIHQKRIMEALRIAYTYGQVDNWYHRAWTIDQMVRKLTGPKYRQWVRRYEEGDDVSEPYQWDTGIAP